MENSALSLGLRTLYDKMCSESVDENTLNCSHGGRMLLLVQNILVCLDECFIGHLWSVLSGMSKYWKTMKL